MTDPSRIAEIAEIDPFRSVHLGGGWGAAVCIHPDGEESLWLLSPIPDAKPGCACPDCAPHDQLTPAPINITHATGTSR